MDGFPRDDNEWSSLHQKSREKGTIDVYQEKGKSIQGEIVHTGVAY